MCKLTSLSKVKKMMHESFDRNTIVLICYVALVCLRHSKQTKIVMAHSLLAQYHNTPLLPPKSLHRHCFKLPLGYLHVIMKITGKIIFKTAFRCPHDTIIRSKYNIQQITRTSMFKFKFLVPRG